LPLIAETIPNHDIDKPLKQPIIVYLLSARMFLHHNDPAITVILPFLSFSPTNRQQEYILDFCPIL
jgi:hypothetical protein